MSVIAATLTTVAFMALMTGVWSAMKEAKQCQAVSDHPGSVYNVCVLTKYHGGSHVAADGMRF